MNDKEKIAQRKKQLRVTLKSHDLTVDTINSTIERRFLQPMIDEAVTFSTEMMDDYEFLVSPEVKEIVLADYMRVTANIRALKYVAKHHPDAVPDLGGKLGGYKDAII